MWEKEVKRRKPRRDGWIRCECVHEQLFWQSQTSDDRGRVLGGLGGASWVLRLLPCPWREIPHA